jgi:hypothetical protein
MQWGLEWYSSLCWRLQAHIRSRLAVSNPQGANRSLNSSCSGSQIFQNIRYSNCGLSTLYDRLHATLATGDALPSATPHTYVHFKMYCNDIVQQTRPGPAVQCSVLVAHRWPGCQRAGRGYRISREHRIDHYPIAIRILNVLADCFQTIPLRKFFDILYGYVSNWF